MLQTPKVFISYSHDSQSHKDWVRRLAEALLACGIEVVLDQWDLRLGQDVPGFMASAIREVDRVLVVCTERYVEKADGRRGGAGYEGMVIDSQIARNLSTTKFIPVLRQSGSKEPLPSFLGTRLYVDLRTDAEFAERLLDLVHDIYDQPRIKKPARGSNPFVPPPGTPASPAALQAGDVATPLRWQDDLHLRRDALDYLRNAPRAPRGGGTPRRKPKSKLSGADLRLQELRTDWFALVESILRSHVGRREAVAINQSAIQMYNEAFSYRDFDKANRDAHIAESDTLHDRLIASLDAVRDADVRDQLRAWLEISKHNMERRYIHLRQ